MAEFVVSGVAAHEDTCCPNRLRWLAGKIVSALTADAPLVLVFYPDRDPRQCSNVEQAWAHGMTNAVRNQWRTYAGITLLPLSLDTLKARPPPPIL